MYQIYFYVPKESLNKVKEAMFAAGAGQIGDYQKCAWQVEGVGQFMPKVGANPAIGEIDKLEEVVELRVEMVCKKEKIKEVVKAMLHNHPYEEVAYGILPILTLKELP